MILPQAVVERCWFPRFGEEDHADRLPEVVELEAGAADGGEDGGVVDGFDGDVERAGAEHEVGVCGCSVFRLLHQRSEGGRIGFEDI